MFILPQQSSHPFADDAIELSEDAHYIRRKTKHERLSIKEQGFCRASKAVELGLQLAAQSQHTGLLLPADIRYANCFQSARYKV